MNLFIITITILFYSLFLYKYGKTSIVSLDINLWSLLFYKEIFFIVPSVFFVSIYGVDSFRTFILAKEEFADITSWIIIYSVISFITFIIMFSFLGVKKTHFTTNVELFDTDDHNSILIFGYSAVFSGLVTLLIAMFLLDYRHAFLYTIFSGENLIKIRLENTYSSKLPSQVSYLLSITTFISSIFSVYLLRIGSKKISFIVIVLSFLLATSGGAKGVVIDVLVVALASYLFFFRPRINILGLLFKSILFLFISLVLLFYVVSLQIQDLKLEGFFLYLIDRVGVDQMAGTYETFSVQLHSTEYAWHAIPFAHFFVDYPIFSKDLMMMSEGRDFESTGVKNSLFISEAFAMGGWLLAIFSPVFFSLGYIIKLIIIYFYLKIFFTLSVSRVFTIPLLFLTTRLTGDFSSIALQKGTILLLAMLFLIYISSIFIKKFLSSSILFSQSRYLR